MASNPTILAVIGCPRSGTTLLQAQLARHFDLTPLAETHFIELFNDFKWLWGNCHNEDSRRNLLRALQEFTKIRWDIISGFTLPQIRKISILPTLEDEKSIVDQSWNYQSLIKSMFLRHAELANSEGIIEKFSYYYPVNLFELAKLLEKCVFIHVIRDGRDVALSWTKTWFGPRTISEACRLWDLHVRHYSEWGRQTPQRYLEVTYRDLLCDQENILEKVSRFIEMEQNHSVLNGNNVFEVMATRPHYQKANSLPDAGNLIKWPQQMSPDHARIFWSIAGDTANGKGFEVSPGWVANQYIPLLWRERLRERIGGLFDTVKWKRRLVRLLPFAIKMGQIANVSLYKKLKYFKERV